MRIAPQITAVFPVPNDPDKAEVTIIHLTPGQIEDVNEKMAAFKTIIKRTGDTMEPEIHQNSSLGDRRYLFTVESIKSWSGFKDAKGKDMPCDYKSKIAMARAADVVVTRDDGIKERISFSNWIAECRAELAKQAETCV